MLFGENVSKKFKNVKNVNTKTCKTVNDVQKNLFILFVDIIYCLSWTENKILLKVLFLNLLLVFPSESERRKTHRVLVS